MTPIIELTVNWLEWKVELNSPTFLFCNLYKSRVGRDEVDKTTLNNVNSECLSWVEFPYFSVFNLYKSRIGCDEVDKTTLNNVYSGQTRLWHTQLNIRQISTQLNLRQISTQLNIRQISTQLNIRQISVHITLHRKLKILLMRVSAGAPNQ